MHTLTHLYILNVHEQMDTSFDDDRHSTVLPINHSYNCSCSYFCQIISSIRMFKPLSYFFVCFIIFSIFLQLILLTPVQIKVRALISQYSYRAPSQKWIKEQLNSFYDAMGSKYQPPANWTHEQVPMQSYYFPEINVIFTGIPKTGCSHWIELFLQAEGVLEGRLEYLPDVHANLSLPYRLHFFSEAWNGTHDQKIKTATSMVALRNPWVRAVSAYRQKLSSEKTQGNTLPYLQLAILRSQRNFSRAVLVQLESNLTVTPTFEEYVRYTVQKTEKILADPHFRPQYKFLSIDNVRYDYIIPMEFAEQMSADFFKQVGIEISLPGSYDRQIDPKLQTSVVRAKELFSSLNQELVDKFYKVYREDFLLLNYSNFSDPNFPLPNGYC